MNTIKELIEEKEKELNQLKETYNLLKNTIYEEFYNKIVKYFEDYDPYNPQGEKYEKLTNIKKTTGRSFWYKRPWHGVKIRDFVSTILKDSKEMVTGNPEKKTEEMTVEEIILTNEVLKESLHKWLEKWGIS